MHIYNISYIIYMDIYLYIYVYLIYLKRGSQYIMEINMKQLGNQLRHLKRIHASIQKYPMIIRYILLVYV